MAERGLRIEAFRNIGFKDGKPEATELLLNNSLKKGEMGGLVILIGANNSGKSNVLEALNIFGNEKITERDVTDLPFDDECKHPKLTLFSRNDDDKEDEFAYTENFEEKNLIDGSYKFQYSTKENILSDLDKLSMDDFDRGFRMLRNDLWEFYPYRGKQPEKEISDKEFKILRQEIFKILRSRKKYQKKAEKEIKFHRFFEEPYNPYDDYDDDYYEYLAHYNDFIERISEIGIFKEFEAYENYRTANTPYAEKYGYNFMPESYVYKGIEISEKDLAFYYGSRKHIFVNNNEAGDFFKKLFYSIGMDTDTVKNIYNKYTKTRDIEELRKIDNEIRELEDSINQKLQSITSKKFNTLFHIKEGDSPYSFKIFLDRDGEEYIDSLGLRLSLFHGDKIVNIAHQSTGFRWFFNLFFNLLNSTTLNPGDIIIMDEPAMNLHVKGQRELRAFLKDFAIKNDITIVIATHSPFLIDLDYLDELRVVVNDGTVSHIVNNFAAVDPTDPDSLLPIKDSLTVENHILVNPDEKLIFVEGITDYNYLTAFKKLFGEQGITFLPINGVGENESDCKKISKELIRIRKHNPILLVDNDKAGQQMKKVNADSALTVIALNEIDESFKTIESLFGKEDLQNFGLLDENGTFVKHASTSTVFKNQILKNKDAISETTRANFRKLFDKLLHEAE